VCASSTPGVPPDGSRDVRSCRTACSAWLSRSRSSVQFEQGKLDSTWLTKSQLDSRIPDMARKSAWGFAGFRNGSGLPARVDQ
jgi:hypothetical protein